MDSMLDGASMKLYGASFVILRVRRVPAPSPSPDRTMLGASRGARQVGDTPQTRGVRFRSRGGSDPCEAPLTKRCVQQQEESVEKSPSL
jgi:hypothetical protein